MMLWLGRKTTSPIDVLHWTVPLPIGNNIRFSNDRFPALG